MADRELFDIVVQLATIDDDTQDAIIFRLVEHNLNIQLYFPATYSFKSLETGNNAIGKSVTLGKLGQAYSQHAKNDIPFVFEGEEIPGTNLGKMAMAKAGFKRN